MYRFFKTLVLVVIPVVAGVAMFQPAQALDLPDQLVKFLPANPDILLVVPSVQEMDRAWEEMRALAADFGEEGDKPLPTLKELFGKGEPMIYEMIDQDRPFALAVSVPNMMGGQEPLFYGVLPLKDGDWDLDGLSQQFKTPTMIRQDGYLLVTQDPEFVEAATPTRLLDHLPQGTLMFCADLASIWGTFNPMLDFALMAAAAPKPTPEGEDGPPQPQVTPEQTAAMGDMVRIIMESADVLAMGMDLREKQVYFNEEFTVLAGSSLAPPAQPQFAKALELTRYLPRDSDWTMAYSVEMGGILDLYKDFYLTALEMQYADLKEQTGLDLADFMEVYFESLDLVMAPTAMSFDLDRQTIKAQYVMKTDEAEAIIEMQNRLMELFGEGGPMLTVSQIEGLKVEGFEVHAWDYDWDLEQMMTMATAAVDSSDAPDAAELATSARILEEFLPGIRMVTKDDLMFVSLGTDLKPLAQMVKQAKQSRSAVNPGLAKLAQRTGPDCQGVFQGDLGAILTLVYEIAEEVSGEDLSALKLDPMLMNYALRIDDRTYGVDYQVDISEMAEFIAALEELEEKHKKKAKEKE